MIQPAWFLYDKESSKIYIATSKMSKKIKNILRNPDKIYFSIDDENYPYKGVKGRGVARIFEDTQKNLPIVEKINIKYLGTLEHPLAKMIIENTKNGIEVVIEITPKFFSHGILARLCDSTLLSIITSTTIPATQNSTPKIALIVIEYPAFNKSSLGYVCQIILLFYYSLEPLHCVI
jgi:hypothetical protein